MAGVPRSNDYESRIQRLERAVGILQRQSTLTSASIGEGGLTVRDNGEIRGIGTGKLDWNGPAHFGGNTDIGGQLDVTGNTHISGDLLIDGDTTLGGHLIFAPGSVPPEAFARRTESQTFGGTSTTGSSNTFNLSVTVNVPSWAQTTSCIAMSTVYAEGSLDGVRLGGRITIGGNAGPDGNSAVYLTAGGLALVHRRDFSPSGSFTVVTSGGTSPVTFDADSWGINSVIMCTFLKTS